MRKKVLFFLPAGIGGAERVSMTIAKFLDENIYDVGFVIIAGRHPEQVSDTLAYIPKTYKTQIINIRNIWNFATLRLAVLMRKERPNIVFCSLRYLNIRVILAAKLVGHICVIVRNDYTIMRMPWYNRLMIKLSFPHADIVIAQQEEMRQEILDQVKIDPNKVKVLHNPLDCDTINEKIKALSPYNEDTLSIRYVCVSRIIFDKGQDTLVRAFKKVHDEKPNAQLYFVGMYYEEDDFYQGLRKYVLDNGLNDAVHFVGFTDNPYTWVKHCDCYVMPSRMEGLPNALIDAMYIGKPVVATMCIPIIERMVKDGYNGYLVPLENVEAMSRAMLGAVKLTDFAMTYKPATKEDFCKLFE